jgi:tRNA-dihydrouridine synthase B
MTPFGLAPMAGMTDTAFRRLVKRLGGCSLVVSEMVSSEGLVRGQDKTLEYAEFTEEERPVAIQIFGGDPGRMARAAQVVEAIGADIVDVNMGCPVPKIAKGSAGCSLMREPGRAAAIVAAMVKAVRIPVTVKMRAGWNDREVNAPELARRMEDAGAAGLAVHGRTAAQSYTGLADWDVIAAVAAAVSIPVWGNGDCNEPHELLDRMRGTGVAGILVGRGVLRNPWIFAQAAALAEGRPLPVVSMAARGRFLIDYIDLLLADRSAEAEGFRHLATRGHLATDPLAIGHLAIDHLATDHLATDDLATDHVSTDHLAIEANRQVANRQVDNCQVTGQGNRQVTPATARPRDRHVVNKLRALSAWYTRGLEHGHHLRHTINRTESVPALRQVISDFFGAQ